MSMRLSTWHSRETVHVLPSSRRSADCPWLAQVPATPAHGRTRPFECDLAEPFRTLHTNLRYLDVERPITSVLVTSPGHGEGTSTVARELASAAAASGSRTLLIDA